MLSKKDILAAEDIQKEVVKVPEWGGEVMVYGLTCGEKDQYEQSLVSEAGKVDLKGATATLITLCVRDEMGCPIFSPMDVTALTNKASRPMERISKVAQKLSGMGKNDLEDMVKNSETIQKDGSD